MDTFPRWEMSELRIKAELVRHLVCIRCDAGVCLCFCFMFILAPWHTAVGFSSSYARRWRIN